MNANGRSVRRLHGLLLVLFAVLAAPRVVNADVRIDWNAGATIESNAYTTSNETYHIRIKGNVTMNGHVQVGDNNSVGTTMIVEIDPSVTGPVTLTHTGKADVLFAVHDNCKLIIRGKSDSQRIIIEGNNTHTTYEMIGTAGTLEMQYVTVQNNKQDKGSNNGVIKINPGWEEKQKLGTTTIRNCSFINCSAGYATVLYTSNETKPQDNPDNTAASCAILMQDVVIDGCKATYTDNLPNSDPSQDTDPGSGWAGILRFRGVWLGNFTMNNVEISNCSAEYSCAGVFWNAMGVPKDPDRQPKLTVIGCKFHDNTCGRSGGAMRIETFCEFTEKQTVIYNNTAGIMGGGIHMYGYSAENLGTFDFNYYLTDKLYVHDNTAQYGGGIGFQLNNCLLDKGSSFNLHFNGAKIDNNHATVKGGGVYCEDISEPANKYKVNIYLNSGQLNGNQVYKDSNESWDKTWSGTFYDKKNSDKSVVTEEAYKMCGGAVFVYNTNIGHSADGELTMNNNRCMRRGGAVCVTGSGASINLSKLTADGNMAQDGGGLACMSPDGTAQITLGNLQLTNCSCLYGWGGGAFMEGGKLVVNNNATISGSSAPHGGGIHLRSSSVLDIQSAFLSGNSASERGGAIYATETSSIKIENATISGNKSQHGGGLTSVSGSTSEIGSATFDRNEATSNGGAIYLEKGGTLKITAGATFTNNTAVDGGGAICVKVNNNTASEYITGTITNATFRSNSAYRGGAIELDGKDVAKTVDFTLQNNVMENNVAKLGGALLVNEAKLTYNGGKIRWNKAEYVDGGPKTSFGYFPYNWNDNCFLEKKFSGFGGGIIVSKAGVLIISKEHPFGIYENHADVGGNDISTVCSDWNVYKGTSPMREEYKFYPATLSIPNADNLDLSGFDVPVPRSAISWMEDYNAKDGAYAAAGTHKLSSPNRYSDMLKTAEGMKNLSKAMVNPEDPSTPKYLHLTMGYNFVFVKLMKSGLKEGETAIFRVSYRANDTDPYKQYMDFTITGKEGGVDVEKTIALTVGKWKIEETDWAYTYDRPADKEFVLTQEDALSETVKTLSFSNKKNEGKHDAESTKVNKIEIK